MALYESSAMGSYVGFADFTFCPGCFSKLDAKDDPLKCSLCGAKLDPVKIESYHLRLKHELSQQLKESQQLQKERENARGRFLHELEDILLRREY